MILVDASIWVEMFRRGRFKAELATLIANDQLCTHPFVVAELACGYLPHRQQTLLELDNLTALPTIRTADVRYMIETRGLFSKGIGLIDAQLIAACISTHGTQIWTIDRPLGRVAESLGLRANPT
jgi:predicted nucleic acid-binding protein